MSTSDAAITEELSSSLQLLAGLRKSSFRRLVEARKALWQVNLVISNISSSFADADNASINNHVLDFLGARNAVPMLRDFAGTALLQLQQQPVLKAPAADLATISVVVEGLACALRLPSSKPATATVVEQQTCGARTGATVCSATVCAHVWRLHNTARTAIKSHQQHNTQAFNACRTSKQDLCCRMHVACGLPWTYSCFIKPL
jgi:hypothetical protein